MENTLILVELRGNQRNLLGNNAVDRQSEKLFEGMCTLRYLLYFLLVVVFSKIIHGKNTRGEPEVSFLFLLSIKKVIRCSVICN